MARGRVGWLERSGWRLGESKLRTALLKVPAECSPRVERGVPTDELPEGGEAGVEFGLLRSKSRGAHGRYSGHENNQMDIKCKVFIEGVGAID